VSHIRWHLDADDRQYRSVAMPASSPLATAATVPPPSGTAAVPAATSAAWRAPLRAIAACLATWRARRRARRELAAVDARSYRDLGIAPELVDYEASRPFWCRLRNWRD
jgi:uncharacterized protein YjiS (DUF1127 family)